MDLRASGQFRQDLLYRINTIEIRVPALRERVDDIPALAAHFARIYARKYNKPEPGFDDAATARKLKQYSLARKYCANCATPSNAW